MDNMIQMTESVIEETVLVWFESLGYTVEPGIRFSPSESNPERTDYRQVVLVNRLRRALEHINPTVPAEAIEDAIRQITRINSPSFIHNNRNFHKLLTEGIDFSYQLDGSKKTTKAWIFDLEDIESNDWLVVNQFSIKTEQGNRRADILVFVNGLPLAILELKNPTDANATISHAFNQLQEYKKNIHSLFIYNELMIASDGFNARIGSITAGPDRFMPWRTIDGSQLASPNSLELEVMIKGVFQKHIFLDLILNFIAFDDNGSEIIKKIAAYHQYYAINKAIECAFSACGIPNNPTLLTGRFPAYMNVNSIIASPPLQYGEGTPHYEGRKIGVIWHTQGSFKSQSMVFFAGKLIRHPQMENPTIVVITDRNDLDEQLYSTFSNCHALLRQKPEKARNRDHLKALLNTAAGGVIFSTIQKFHPPQKGESYPQLSDRRNIIVIADEAHRSQYDFIDGFARHLHDALPNASFIGFTGTPIEREDRSTPAVFGDYIDKYDILRAVQDGATVPIYYENRIANLQLLETEKPNIDPEFKEITEDQEEEQIHKLQSKWARLEALVGTHKRIQKIAEDILDHFDQRLETLEGKGLIVCMSRRICVELYEAIVKLRPEWHNPNDSKGEIKIVMTGDIMKEPNWEPHIRTKIQRDQIAKRFKNPDDPLKLVIVRDMWLTGFDCPPLHTMYIDKPMKQHQLMQAIARVNRVYKDKPGGLVVDYIGLLQQLKEALAQYTSAGGEGVPAHFKENIIPILQEKFQIVLHLFDGFQLEPLLHAPPIQRMQGIAAAIDFLLSIPDHKKRFLDALSTLLKVFALAVPCQYAFEIRDYLLLFQEIRTILNKRTIAITAKTPQEIDTAIRQLVSRSVDSQEVIDIFQAAGMKTPDISIFSDAFLEEIRHLQYPHLTIELLQKLISDHIASSFRRNIVRARSFAAMLEETIRRYQNRTIDAIQVIEELIQTAKTLNQALRKGDDTGLNEDERAFYDALEANDSAVKVLGDETLYKIARELVKAVQNSITIDWTMRESVRAHIRTIVKRILRKHGYPPDKQEKATELVLEQAQVLCQDWVLE